MKNNKWIKWQHDGIPDKLGEAREIARDKLEFLSHCKKCTALSGCYFISNNKPNYLQHAFCDCDLLPIIISADNITAVCDIRKLTEYIFRLDNNRGKTYIFEDWGYNIGDSQNLKAEFESQAKEKYLSGDYELQVLDGYGQRITIEITLHDKEKNDKIIRTGWMVKPLGQITCSAPFSGVVK